MNIAHYTDDIKAWLSIVALVLCGGLIFGGGVFIYHTWDVAEIRRGYVAELDKMRDERNNDLAALRAEKTNELEKRDSRIEVLSGQVTHLTSIIEQRLPLIVDQAAENVEKIDRLSVQVDNAATQSKRAASAANKAASQAGKAVKSARQPGGGIRIVPTQSKGPSCFMGKTVYGDPC